MIENHKEFKTLCSNDEELQYADTWVTRIPSRCKKTDVDVCADIDDSNNNMVAECTPRCVQSTIPAPKRIYTGRPASVSPSVKPKLKKTKAEENRGNQESLNDIYALIKDIKVDIQNKIISND